MKFRKRDYIIFYGINLLMLVMNMIGPLKIRDILILLIIPIFDSLILGTITNLIFKKR